MSETTTAATTVTLPPNPPPGRKENSVHEWEAAIKEAAASRDKTKTENEALRAQVKAFADAEAARTRDLTEAQQKAETERLTAEGRYKELLEKATATHAAEADKLRAAYKARLIPTAIKAAAAEIPNLTPEALADLPELLRPHIAVGDTLEEFVLDPKTGKPFLDDKLNPVPVPAFIKSFVASRPYMLRDAMPARHGAAAGTGTVPVTFADALASPAVMEQWRASDPEGLAKARDAYYDPAAVKARAKLAKRA